VEIALKKYICNQFKQCVLIAIDNILVSDLLIEEQFVCDLLKCKGGCCEDGDAGAPLEEAEMRQLKAIYPEVKPNLTPEGIREIEANGLYNYDREFGWVTPTIGTKMCAYGFRDRNGVIKCGIEQAYYDGKTSWKKPISCHLYPVKINHTREYELLIGALLQSRIFADGATVASSELSMVGVEAEIAFRFDRSLPPRERAYEREEIAEAATAFPAIEVLDSRFRDYHGMPAIDRAADFMSNSAFVMGAPRYDWRSFDLATLEARLVVDGAELVRTIGGHAAGDPLNPALALANTFRQSTGISAGHVVTTGTYTGLQFVKKNSAVKAIFVGFGEVGCRFVP